MAGAAIAIALILVAIVSVPVPMWIAKTLASFSRRRRTALTSSGAALARSLHPGLRRLVEAGHRARTLIDGLGPIAADYRRTLPYVNLFFADVRTCLDVRSARWVVLARQDYELAVSDLARLLLRWRHAFEALGEDEALLADAAGGGPSSVAELLDDGTRLPRSPIEAQRLRFCEAWEVERLEASLERVAADLLRFEQALVDVHVGPYR